MFSSLNYPLFVDYYPCPFRQVGILQDFTYSGAGINPAYLQACYAVKVSAPPTGSVYRLGEVITQLVKSDGVDKLAKGLVVGWDSVSNVLRYTQSSVNKDTDGQLYRFNGQNNIEGAVSCTPDTTYSGTIGDTTFTDGYAQPELTKYTGLMTYLTNISPVVRDPNQTERISLVIAF